MALAFVQEELTEALYMLPISDPSNPFELKNNTVESYCINQYKYSNVESYFIILKPPSQLEPGQSI